MKSRAILAIIFILLVTNSIKNSDKAYSQSVKAGKDELIKHLLPKRLIPINIERKLSLSNFIKRYNKSYSETFIATLAAISSANVDIASYDSSKGEINAVYKNKKQLFILVIPENDKITLVRITPADGVYNISDKVLSEIFENIKTELTPVNKNI